MTSEKTFENEEWRQIKGAVPGYEVSSLGRVRHKNPRSNFSETGADNGHGYLQTPVYFENGSKKLQLVHRLVAQAFIENPLNLPEVNHINGNKSDNSVSNLEWVTRKGNAIHASLSGLRKCKLSKEQIDYIRDCGKKQTDVASELSVSQRLICRIRRGEIYSYY